MVSGHYEIIVDEFLITLLKMPGLTSIRISFLQYLINRKDLTTATIAARLAEVQQQYLAAALLKRK